MIKYCLDRWNKNQQVLREELEKDPSLNSCNYAYLVNSNGTQYNDLVCNARIACPRPALALSSEILVSNSTDSEGCYTVDDAVVAGAQYQKVNGVWRRMM